MCGVGWNVECVVESVLFMSSLYPLIVQIAVDIDKAHIHFKLLLAGKASFKVLSVYIKSFIYI